MHSIWLVPDARGHARFSDLINRHAAKWGGPVFEPHITLLADVAAAPDAIISECAGMFAGFARDVAAVHGVDCTDKYYMSLFADIALPGNFADSHHRLSRLFGGERPGTFRPHLSLTYGQIDRADRGELCRHILSELADFTFGLDAVELVAASKEIPVGQWKTVWRHDLKEAPMPGSPARRMPGATRPWTH